MPHADENMSRPAPAQGGFIPIEQVQGRRRFWRTPEEAFLPESSAASREWGGTAPQDMEALPRREFMRLMGATLALAGASGCAIQPAERIVPYVHQPENLIPGKAQFYATAFCRGGYAQGLLGESHMGRPVKLEGNPDHPASLGSTDAMAQGSLLTLYDPDRSQAVRSFGYPTSWNEFTGELQKVLADQEADRGAGLRLVFGSISSPTLQSQIEQLLNRFPAARVTLHEPAGRESVRIPLAGGRYAEPVYDLAAADVIVSLDSDFLSDEPGSVRYARDFAAGRRIRDGRLKMNRLYVIESGATITGAAADHRVAAPPSAVEGIARAISGALGAGGGGRATGISPQFLQALTADLTASAGRSLVIAGPHQPPRVHALVRTINRSLGNEGKTVRYIESPLAQFGARQQGLKELAAELARGEVAVLVTVGSNPAYTAPADLQFAEGMALARLRIHMGLYDDESGILSQWHVPQSHFLEAWSDARAYDGTVSIIQPLVRPLHESHSAHELLAAMLGQAERSGYDIVREYWMGRRGTGRPATGPAVSGERTKRPAPTPEFEKFWRQALDRGIVPGTAAASVTPEITAPPPDADPAPATGGLELVFRPDPYIWDGEYGNNGWLQELPRPLSALTWDNAAILSPGTARSLGVQNGSYITLTSEGRRLRTAVLVQPGQPDSVVTLHLGYGRTRAGRLATGLGFNAYSLRTTAKPWIQPGAQAVRAAGSYVLARTQTHFNMEGRNLIQQGNLVELQGAPKAPPFMHHEHGGTHTLFPDTWPSDYLGSDQRERSESGPAANGEEHGAHGADWSVPEAASGIRGYNGNPPPQWGMVIDLNACIGCNACTIACQAENNIATVGKDQVAISREMHWIRVDTYFEGDPAAPDSALFQPVPCQHCEKAPCEPVCPVEATSHSVEGVNEMTYNRCIGTRYCANNCPYKVRRFNYLQFSDQKTPLIQMSRNPDVTVRSRGVMEKCTYCVQRINEARISAEKDERTLQDGDVVTACQQVCPTQAIVFGDLQDQKSHGGHGSLVRQLKSQPTNYNILNELNTRPRTSYLARLRNPNPELERAGGSAHGGG